MISGFQNYQYHTTEVTIALISSVYYGINVDFFSVEKERKCEESWIFQAYGRVYNTGLDVKIRLELGSSSNYQETYSTFVQDLVQDLNPI